MAGTRLARLGLSDPARAEATLTALRLWDDGPRDAGAEHVVAALGAAPDPDLALAGLARLAEAVAKPAVLLATLRSSAGLRRRLLPVLGLSAPLADHLVRHPREWVALADERLPETRPTALGLRDTLLRAVGADPAAAEPRAGSGGPDAYDALRVAYRSALLRLAARDLGEGLAMEHAAGELADLAAATLDAALAVSRAAVGGAGPLPRLAVVGMGKCGGRELNYVSDVDVVFVAEPADPVATRLAEGVIRVCGTATAEGSIWPVDAGLRPEGRLGPLVRTLASHEAYYRRWARNWEFQALLKARPIAGDADLGRAYCDAVAPLVWTESERPDLVAETQAMKRRVEASVPAAEEGRQLKLGPGGLRDVEFSVQLLQLVHGRADPALRSGHTLAALEALAAGGYVGADDAQELGEAYRFLRRVEHRLQLRRLRRTHVLPADDGELRVLARSLGLRATPEQGEVERLRAELDRSAVRVRRLHEKLFYRPLLTAVARLPAAALRLAPEAAQTRLAALGFADPAGALRHLEALSAGLSRRAGVLRAMLPVMLPWFADAHDPDGGLVAFRQVVEAVGDSPWFLGLLRDDAVAAERLARLLATSRYVADLLTRAPEAVGTVTRDDELAARPAASLRAELSAAAARHEAPAEAATAVRALRRHELLRVAAADLLGRLDVDAVGEALTAAADATLAAALEVAERSVGPLACRIAVVGMGRLGGREQGYGSDADVMFVHEPLPGATDAEAAASAKAVAEELRRLLALPAPDPPLHVDADLRPEGRQGPLTLSLPGYARYYERRAAVWEAQALLRARPVAGDADLGARFERLVAPVRWPAELGDEAVREIRRIKARVEAERLPRGVDPHRHLKLGPGGLADVEWTVQLLQLRHAARVPGLRTTSTLGALAAAVEADLLAEADAGVLAEAWTLTTRLRNAVLLVRKHPTDVLPSDARVLAGTARALGYPAGSQSDFVEHFRRATRRARSVVERVFYA